MLGPLKVDLIPTSPTRFGKKRCIAHIPPEFAFPLATQHKRNCHKQHEIYMANTNLTLVYATQTIFHLLTLGSHWACIGSAGWRWVPEAFQIVSAMRSARVVQSPNAMVFALQWNKASKHLSMPPKIPFFNYKCNIGRIICAACSFH